VEKQTGNSTKILSSGNGVEAFTAYLQKEGIRYQVTVPDTPEKNGTVKRPHIIQEKTRIMMQEAKFRVIYWAEAVNTAAYLKNLSP
jgi:hypothetical protein